MSKELFILDLPIEGMDQRYSTQWVNWFEKAYKRANINFQQIDPIYGVYSNDEKLDPEKFLDPFTTFKYKTSQLHETVKILQSRTDSGPIVVFLHDFWYPGIEALEYIATFHKLNLTICGFAHAGSYDDTDLLGRMGMHTWARGSEQTWFKLCKKIFVGSNWHRNRLLAALGDKASDEEKVIVTGCPIDVPLWNPDTPKENIVVWPHRLSEDKYPQRFDQLKSAMEKCTNYQFIKTKELNLSKKEYYELLAKSKIAVSTADHENFGISLVESAMLGCYCVAPNSLAYKETIEEEFRYVPGDLNDLQLKVEKCMRKTSPYKYPFASKFHQSHVTDQIVQEIKECFE